MGQLPYNFEPEPLMIPGSSMGPRRGLRVVVVVLTDGQGTVSSDIHWLSAVSGLSAPLAKRFRTLLGDQHTPDIERGLAYLAAAGTGGDLSLGIFVGPRETLLGPLTLRDELACRLRLAVVLERATQKRRPVDLVVMAQPLPVATGQALLRRCALVGQNVAAPFLVAVSEETRVEWSAKQELDLFRERPEAAWLALACGEPLLAPGEGQEPIAGGPVSAAFVVAAAIARGSRDGSVTQFVGRGCGGDLVGLDSRWKAPHGRDDWLHCAAAGLVTLCREDEGGTTIVAAPTLARVPSTWPEARNQPEDDPLGLGPQLLTQLPWRLMVNRVLQLLRFARDDAAQASHAAPSGAELEQVLARALTRGCTTHGAVVSEAVARQRPFTSHSRVRVGDFQAIDLRLVLRLRSERVHVMLPATAHWAPPAPAPAGRPLRIDLRPHSVEINDPDSGLRHGPFAGSRYPHNRVEHPAVSPCGRYVAFADNDLEDYGGSGSVRVYHIASGAEVEVEQPAGCNAFLAIEFSDDSRQVVATELFTERQHACVLVEAAGT